MYALSLLLLHFFDVVRMPQKNSSEKNSMKEMPQELLFTEFILDIDKKILR